MAQRRKAQDELNRESAEAPSRAGQVAPDETERESQSLPGQSPQSQQPRRAEVNRLPEPAAESDSIAKLFHLLENLPDVAMVVDRQSRILYANRPAPNTPIENLVGSIGFAHVRPEDVAKCRQALETAFTSGAVEVLEVLSVYGEHWECRLAPIESHREVSSVVIICTDVSDRRRAEERVIHEQELLRNLLSLHERDRKLLAHEIHDGFVQDVVGAKMQLESAIARLESPDEPARAELDGARALLAKALTEARRMMTELRPMIIDEDGIVQSINYLLAEGGGTSDLEVEFQHDGHFDRMDPILEGTVFRIAQEALNNVRRHSGSNSVEIRLTHRSDTLLLEIRDHGVGFDPDRVPTDRFGLRGIRERARLFGGKAVIDAAPGRGTRVRVELPMRPGSAGASRPCVFD